MDLGVKGLRQPGKPLGCKTVCWFCYISLCIGNFRLKTLKVVFNKRRMISQDLKKKGRTSLLRYITDKVSTWSVDYPCFHNINYWEYCCSRAVFNCVPKVIRDCSWFSVQSVGFPLLRFVIGPENSRLSLSVNHMQNKNQSRLGCPRFFRWFYFEFSLVTNGIFLSSDWLLW